MRSFQQRQHTILLGLVNMAEFKSFLVNNSFRACLWRSRNAVSMGYR